MNRYRILLPLIVLPFCLPGLTTNRVDLAALAACGTGVTNGWTLAGIDSYADKTSIRINSSGEYLCSPAYSGSILEIIIAGKSSSQGGKHLAFIPLIDGRYNTDAAVICAYSPNKDTYIRQHLAFAEGLSVTAFKIAYSEDGEGNTGWGIAEMTILTDDESQPSPLNHPTVSRIRSRSAQLSWINPAAAVSNAVSVFSLTTTPESGVLIADYDFSLCVNPGANDTQDRSREFSELYPEFTATRLYYPADSSGIVRISSGTANGYLTFAGLPSYRNLSVAIRAKRYPGDQNCSAVSLVTFDDNGTTNLIGTISLDDEFSTSIINLSSVTDARALTLVNLDGFKSHRRFLLDDIRFIRDYVPATTVTNRIALIVSADPDATLLRGLSPETHYLARIQTYDVRGQFCAPAASIAFTTRTAASGSMILLR